MLSEWIMLGIIFLLSIGTPICVCKAFKDGYNFGVKDYNRAHRGEEKSIPTAVPKNIPADNKDLENMRILLDNIDNYDGSSAHQQELN